jgi:hypothetical protein
MPVALPWPLAQKMAGNLIVLESGFNWIQFAHSSCIPLTHVRRCSSARDARDRADSVLPFAAVRPSG